MTNLTDLLPAGAGGKQVSFTADGAISQGDAVVLNTDGTVSTADGSPISQTVGSISSSSFVASGGQPESNSVAYDPVNDKYVIFYNDTLNSGYPNAVVATVTGTTVTFGTPVVVDSNQAGSHPSSQGLVYDSDQQQFIAVWRPNASYSGGRCSIGTLSGTSTSWTSPTTFASGIWVYQLSAIYDAVSQNTVIAYLNLGTDDSSMLTVTNNGSTLTVNTSYVYTSAYSQGYNPRLAYDTANNKVLSIFRSNSNYIAAIAGTISGTSISFGTPTVVFSTAVEYPCLAYDISSGVGVFGCNVTSSPYGRVGYFNISGSTITAGSTTTYNTGGESIYLSLSYDPTAEDCMLAYRDQGNSYQGTFVIITTTSSSISVGSETLFASSPATTAYIGLGIGTTNAKALLAFYDGQYGNTNGYAVAVQKAATLPNYTDFIGIADAAISDTASGNITIKGGVASNGLSSLTPGSTYYVQSDGTLSTTSSSVTAGKALSATSINLDYSS